MKELLNAKVRHQKEKAVAMDFRGFLVKQNALALAIGVIIGAAISKIVTSLVEDVINPVIGLFMPSGDWRAARVILRHGEDAAGKPTETAITYGHLIGALADFIVIAIVVYLIAKVFIHKQEEEKAPTKECPHCKETIRADATRCKACTQPV